MKTVIAPGSVLGQKTNHMKLLITALLFLPICLFSQEIKERTDTAWKKSFRRDHNNNLHLNRKSDTLFKIGDQIEYQLQMGGQVFNVGGWKVLLHKMPKDTVIFLDQWNHVIPVKPKWEADTDWFLRLNKHHRSKIDSL